MKHVILIATLFILSGCRKEPYRDPYLAAVEQYVASLDSVSALAEELNSPPKPSYLNCPVQPESLPFNHSAGVGFSGDTMRRTASLRNLSTRSQAQCEKTNTERKQAYEKALQCYREIIAGSKQ